MYDIPVNWSFPEKIRIFWHLHDAIEMYSDFKNRLIHKIQYGWFHGKTILLSVSQKHKDYVLKCGFPSKQAYYLPNGVDIDRIRLVEVPVDERKYDFLIFGWEYERKGVDLCCQAVKKLNRPIHVAVVGTKETSDLIRKDFEDIHGVEVIPPQADINSLYNQTKCFLHISRAEGLSYALLEAVYAGLPVISSDIQENLFAKVFPTVHFVKNEDVSSIVKAMSDILLVSLIPSEAYLQSRCMIEKDYSISNWVTKLLERYAL